jgi:hypothetical protein
MLFEGSKRNLHVSENKKYDLVYPINQLLFFILSSLEERLYEATSVWGHKLLVYEAWSL